MQREGGGLLFFVNQDFARGRFMEQHPWFTSCKYLESIWEGIERGGWHHRFHRKSFWPCGLLASLTLLIRMMHESDMENSELDHCAAWCQFRVPPAYRQGMQWWRARPHQCDHHWTVGIVKLYDLCLRWLLLSLPLLLLTLLRLFRHCDRKNSAGVWGPNRTVLSTLHTNLK